MLGRHFDCYYFRPLGPPNPQMGEGRTGANIFYTGIPAKQWQMEQHFELTGVVMKSSGCKCSKIFSRFALCLPAQKFVQLIGGLSPRICGLFFLKLLNFLLFYTFNVRFHVRFSLVFQHSMLFLDLQRIFNNGACKMSTSLMCINLLTFWWKLQHYISSSSKE